MKKKITKNNKLIGAFYILLLVVGILFAASYFSQDNSGFGLTKIGEVYNNFISGKNIYFLDENNQPINVLGIEKQNYSGKIYDVTVKNHIILVKGDNSSAIWSGNCYDGVGQLTNTQGKFVQYKTNLYSNDSDMTPNILGYNISSAGTLGSIKNLTVNITDNLAGIANATLYIVNSTNQSQQVLNYTTIVSGNPLTTALGVVVSLIDGFYRWFYQIFDFATNIFTTENRTLIVDNVIPNVILNTPIDSNRSAVSNVNFTANVSDNVLVSYATLWIYNSSGLIYTANQTNINSTSAMVGINISLADGVYNWTYTLVDIADQINITNNRTITIDTIYPSINFTLPTPLSGITQNQNTFSINLSTSDANDIYSFIDLNNTLITWLRLERGNGTFFADDTGRNNGTCFGAGCPFYDYYGKFGTAYRFEQSSGNNSFIDLGNPSNLGFANGSNFTISAWINIGSIINTSTTILGKYSSSQGYIFRVYNDSRGLAFQTDTTNLTSNYTLNYSTWYQVAYRRDFTGQYLYVNGNHVANSSLTTLTNTGTNCYVGAYINLQLNLFNGSLDEVLFFNRGLNANEIKSLYDAKTYPYSTNITNLSGGFYPYKGYVVDVIGNKNQTELRNITINSAPPEINFTAPTESTGSFIARNNIAINVTANSTSTLANITIFVYNSSRDIINQTTTLTSPNFVNITNLAEGIYYYNVSAYDTTGNGNTTLLRNVTIDLTAPLIDYTSGTANNNANLSQNWTYINLTVTELNFNNITFNIYNSSSLINSSSYNTQVNETLFLNLTDGVYYYNATVFDKAGNINSTSTRTITLDTSAPNATLNLPPNLLYTNNQTQNLSVNLSDNLGIVNATLYVYNQTFLVNQTTTIFAPGTISTTIGIVINLIDSVYTWFYQLFDWAGNNALSQNYTLYVDTVNPAISAVIPSASSHINITNNIVQISVNISDASPISVARAIVTRPDSTTQTINLTNATGNRFNNSFTASTSMIGQYNISFYMNDSASNINSSESTSFIIDDNVAPTITLFSTPYNGQTVGTNITLFGATLGDNIALGSCVLYLDGTPYAMNITSTPTSGNCNKTISDLSNGNHTFYIIVNDSSGNINFSNSINYTIDTNLPNTVFASPTFATNYYQSSNNIPINVTATTSGAAIANITIKVYNSTRNLINSSTLNQSNYFANITGLADGVYYYNATAINSVGAESSTETRTIILDTIRPPVSYNSGTLADGINISRTNIYINITLETAEINEANITFNLYNSSVNLINSTTLGAGNRSINFTSLIDGTYYYNVTALDLALNMNTTATRAITLDINAPNGTLLISNDTYLNYSTSINLTANISDNLGIRNATLYVYNQTSLVNQTTTNFAAGTVNTIIGTVVNLVDNVYSWFYSIFDWAGNLFNTNNNTITIDTRKPSIDFASPSETAGSFVPRANIIINVSSNEITANLANITIYLYDSVRSLVTEITNTTSPSLVNITGLSEGIYYYNATSIDKANNRNSSETRNVTIDTAFPSIEYGIGTEASASKFARNNLYINLSANDTNEANVTFRIYNSTSLVNLTTLAAGNREINLTGLASNLYYYNATIIDKAGNINTTSTRTITLETNLPQITNVSYTPSSIDDIDPNTTVAISANILVDSFINLSSIILNYSYNNNTYSQAMSLVSGNFYRTNITTIANETNYTFNIITTDEVGNSNSSSMTNLSSAWDCTWTVSATDLGTTLGFNEKKAVGSFIIRNTGDSQFTNNHCSLPLTITSPLTGRMYYNTQTSLVDYIQAKENHTISVEAQFLTVTGSETAITTITELTSISTTKNQNVSATLATTNSTQPYLVSAIDTPSSSPYSIGLYKQDFSISGYLRNLVGDGSFGKAVYDSQLNWSLPSALLVKDGSVNISDSIILDNTFHYNKLNISLNETNLPSFVPGLYTIYLYAYGYNSSSNLIANVNNETLLSSNITLNFNCSMVRDSILVSACGALDGDYQTSTTITTVTTSTSGGGGGGGASTNARFEKSEASYELLRGKEMSFTLKLINKYPQIMKNVRISVAGLNSEYTSTSPSSIIELAPGEEKDVIVTINAPAYFSGKKYDLIFDISSSLVDPASPSNSMEATDKRYITLYIVEVERGDASSLINQSSDLIKEMNESGLVIKDVLALLEEQNKAYNNIDFLAVKQGYEKIKFIHDNAFEAKIIIENLKAGMAEAEKNGIKTLQTQKVLAVAEVAFLRGDYTLALQRLKEAKLVYALEVKGEFNLIYTVKNNPEKSFSIAISAGIAAWVSSLLIRLRLYKKRLKILSEEEILLLELMKMVQRQCFEEKKMSMEEYDQAMMQYEAKLSETIEDKIRTETKIIDLFKIRARRVALNDEKKRLIELIRKAQDDYLNKGKIETRIYENMIKNYTTRLTEVDEQLAYQDAQDAIKHQTKKDKAYGVGMK